MKRRFAVIAMLLVGLTLCAWCGADGPTAVNPGVGRTRAPLPDLVIKSASVTSYHYVIPQLRVILVVRNIGSAPSAVCTMQVCKLMLVPGTHPMMQWVGRTEGFGMGEIPALAPGAEIAVKIEAPAKDSGSCLLVAVADAPNAMVQKPLGQVPEVSELNNVFAMPYDSGQPGPQDFDNPAVP